VAVASLSTNDIHHVHRTTTSRTTARRGTPYSTRTRGGTCFGNSVHPKSQREDQNPRCDHHRVPFGTITHRAITVLKASLRGLFKSYGEVLDVVAHKNLRMRGQAFVSFATTDIAKKAAKEVRGFPLYSKPMVRSLRDIPFPIDQAIHQSKYRLRRLGQTLWCRSWILPHWILTRRGGYNTRVRLPF